jgi:isoquinoline 1-oxidoreductase beta subunit
MSPVSRREFFARGASAGAGLVVAFYLPGCRSESGNGPFAPNAYLKISPDNKITVMVPRSEMGQGVRTALPMILAEELEADWKTIAIEQVGASTLYGSQQTGSSASVSSSWDPMRKAGAAAKQMLVAAAAQEWGVEVSSCKAEMGTITHPASQKRLSYGDLVGKAAKLPVPADPPLKSAGDYKIVGTRVGRIDTPSKVNGTAEFGMDARVPNMKYALLARCPVFGGKVAGFDDADAKKISGVTFVGKIGDAAVCVVADSVWGAMQGRKALKVQWDEGANADLNMAKLRQLIVKASSGEAVPLYTVGDVKKAKGRRVEATYETPLMAHAPMEPGNCTAFFQGSKCELWAPTQDSQDCQKAVADALGFDIAHVTVNVTLLGGGFGRRLEHDYAVEAALVSKACSQPVKVIWTREDDMRNSFYRPATLHKMSAALDGKGNAVSFSHRTVAPAINFAKGIALEAGVDIDLKDEASFIYSAPNVLVEFVRYDSPVPVGFMRSVYALDMAFASESFVDEVAWAAGKDPLAFRLQMLAKDEDLKFFDTVWKTARMRAVLQLAAEKAGWGKAGAGRHQGLACFGCFSSYAACVVEISMAQGKPKVERVVTALDCGQVVNPGILEQQQQGGTVFALANALRAQITVDKGRVVEGNFDGYAPLRMSEAPVVEAYFVKSAEAPTGAGEPPVAPVAPALGNAIYAATRKRVRVLPLLEA